MFASCPPSRTADLLDTTAPRDEGLSSDDSSLSLQPAIEILFHADARRVGGVTAAWPAGDDGVLVLGRRAPLFVNDRGEAEALDDRFISRAQLLVRHEPGGVGFEVAPAPEARQPVSLSVLDGASPKALTGWQRVPDGALVAIGRRALLRLGRTSRRSPLGDRLGLVGEREALWALRTRIETVARFQESALILGETGTGKELVARALHRVSGASGSFVALNMGGLDAGTAGSELFGHVRGAFTGAQQNRVGAFEAARHGTLFLDEIGDLAPDIQKKLLRVLEDRRFAPLGSHQTAPLECRIVAATHCPLSADVEAGHFRRDLFERLRTLTIPVPPLRQRREDVPRLFMRFLADRSPRRRPWRPRSKRVRATCARRPNASGAHATSSTVGWRPAGST